MSLPSLGALSASDLSWISMPLPPEWILAGAPEARGAVAWKTPERQVVTGLWECTAGRFEYHFARTEVLYVLEGEATVEDEDGRVIALVPGTFARFPSGARTRWTIPDRLRKTFLLLSDA